MTNDQVIGSAAIDEHLALGIEHLAFSIEHLAFTASPGRDIRGSGEQARRLTARHCPLPVAPRRTVVRCSLFPGASGLVARC